MKGGECIECGNPLFDQHHSDEGLCDLCWKEIESQDLIGGDMSEEEE